jgi:outer membrane autotransporter protein
MNNVFGYKFHNGGFALGYDRALGFVDGLVIGISAAFSSGKLDTNDGRSTLDIDTQGFGVYFSYTAKNGVFIDASAALAWSQNDSHVNLVTGGTKTGSFDISTFQIGTRLGVNLEAAGYVFTPSIGIRYLSFRQEAWSEIVEGSQFPVKIFYAKVSDHLVEFPLSIKISRTFETPSVRITPELRLGLTYVAVRPDNVVKFGVQGYNGINVLYGVKMARTTFQAGFGLKIETNSILDAFINYDLNKASGYTEHKASLGFGFEF